jgi:hypothetical protein
MATTIWTNGAGTGDLNTAGNWSNGVPGANGIVIFTGKQSSASVTASLAALTAVDVDLIYIDYSYEGSIGNSGAHLDISADKVIQRGGTLYMTDGAGTTDWFVLDGGTAVLNGDTFTRVTAISGNLTVQSGIGTITYLEIGPRYAGSRLTDISVSLESTTDTVTNLLMSGGRLTSLSTITNAWVTRGTLTQGYNATGAVTNLYLLGGTCVYNSNATIAVAYVLAGTLDLNQDAREKTISLLKVFPAATVLGLNKDQITVTAGGLIFDPDEYA